MGPKATGIVLKPRVFGEMVVVTDHTGVKSKLAGRGKACVCVGYAADHVVGTHHILNLVAKKISLTRNAIFLRQSYGNWNEKKELDKNRNFEESLIGTLKSVGDDNFGEDRNRLFENRPQLVRHIRDSDEMRSL